MLSVGVPEAERIELLVWVLPRMVRYHHNMPGLHIEYPHLRIQNENQQI
jgi:hypothetical protein